MREILFNINIKWIVCTTIDLSIWFSKQITCNNTIFLPNQMCSINFLNILEYFLTFLINYSFSREQWKTTPTYNIRPNFIFPVKKQRISVRKLNISCVTKNSYEYCYLIGLFNQTSQGKWLTRQKTHRKTLFLWYEITNMHKLIVNLILIEK